MITLIYRIFIQTNDYKLISSSIFSWILFAGRVRQNTFFGRSSHLVGRHEPYYSLFRLHVLRVDWQSIASRAETKSKIELVIERVRLASCDRYNRHGSIPMRWNASERYWPRPQRKPERRRKRAGDLSLLCCCGWSFDGLPCGDPAQSIITYVRDSIYRFRWINTSQQIHLLTTNNLLNSKICSPFCLWPARCAFRGKWNQSPFPTSHWKMHFHNASGQRQRQPVTRFSWCSVVMHRNGSHSAI